MGAAATACLIAVPPLRPALSEGSYTLTVTNGPDGCGFYNWTMGESLETPLFIRQMTPTAADPAVAEISGALVGVGGLLVALGVGSHEFTGTVQGQALTLRVRGTTLQTRGSCNFLFDLIGTARVDGPAGPDASGDTFLRNGVIRWVASPVSGDCSAYRSCSTVQTFTGRRTGAAPDAAVAPASDAGVSRN